MNINALICSLVTLTVRWYVERQRFFDRLRKMRRARVLTVINLLKRPMHRERIGPQRRLRRSWKYVRNQFFWEKDVPMLPDDRFQSIFRMSRATFNSLSSNLENILQKAQTQMRQPITVPKRVAIALYFLKSGADYSVVGTTFGVGKATVCGIVDEFCDAVCNVYRDTIKFPATEEEQVEVSNGFLKYWQFPNALSAIDGSHIPILTPDQYGEDYFNYKGWHSTILMATVDYKYRFTYTNIGFPGKVNDAGVFQACSLNHQIAHGLFDSKYHIIGDGAFPLSEFLMKPFIGNNLPEEHEHFNYRLSRARMVVECAFGRLKGRWRVLLKRCDTNFDKTVKIITTCCILHNICENSNDLFHNEWMDDVNNFERLYPQPGGGEYNWDGMDGQRKRNAIVEVLRHIPLD